MSPDDAFMMLTRQNALSHAVLSGLIQHLAKNGTISGPQAYRYLRVMRRTTAMDDAQSASLYNRQMSVVMGYRRRKSRDTRSAV